MDTIIKPTEHVRNLLGKEPLLIYGDIDRGNIILYSNESLPGYSSEGDVYKRCLSLDNPLIVKMEGTLTNGNAYVYPRKSVVWKSPDFEREEIVEDEPTEDLKELFEVDGSFGYIPSAAVMNHFYPDAETLLKVFPSDISLSHEGAHVVSVREMDSLFKDYQEILSMNVMSEEVQQASFHEAVSFLVERKYVEENHPEWLGRYDASRSRDDEMYAEYQEANRLMNEYPDRIEEIISRVREINLKR